MVEAVVRAGPGLTRATRAGVTAGFLASVLVAATSWSSAAVPAVRAEPLRPGWELTAPAGGSPLAALLCLAGAALLAGAWWWLRDAGLGVRQWQRTIALWALPLVVAAPLWSRDLYSYAAQGLLWEQGLSPYDHTVGELDSDWVASTSYAWLETMAPYGPVFLLVARLCAAVSGGNLLVALLLLRLAAVVGLAVIAWSVPEVARRLGHDDDVAARALWLAAANPLVLIHVVGGGHNDALQVAGVLAALVLALRGSLGWSSAVLSLAVMVKSPAALALPFLVLVWAAATAAAEGPATFARVTRGLVVGGGIVATAVLALSLGTGLGLAWVVPRDVATGYMWTSLTTAVGLAVGEVGALLGHADTWTVPAVAVAQRVGLAVFVVVVGALFLGAYRRVVAPAHEHATRAAVRALALAFVALVALSPAIRMWYLLWFLPLVPFAVRTRRMVTVVAVMTTLLIFLNVPDGYAVALWFPRAGIPVAIGLLGALGAAATAEVRRIRAG